MDSWEKQMELYEIRYLIPCPACQPISKQFCSLPLPVFGLPHSFAARKTELTQQAIGALHAFIFKPAHILEEQLRLGTRIVLARETEVNSKFVFATFSMVSQAQPPQFSQFISPKSSMKLCLDFLCGSHSAWQ